MKSTIILIITLLSTILFSCNNAPTISEEDTPNNEIGKIAFQIDMTNAPSEVVDLRGVLSKEGFNSIPFSFFYDDYLVGHWDFEDNGVYDLSSTGNNGRIYGNTSFSSGKKGDAINFDGYDCYAEIPNNNVYNSNEKTISFWMYKSNDYILETDGKTDGEGLIGKAYDTGLRRDFTFAIAGNNPRFHVYGTIGTEGDTLIVTGKTQAISPHYWYHCALVVGENYTEFYLNGTLTEQNYKLDETINTTTPIVLGKLTTSTLPSRYFNGKIDEFRIYNKAFDSNEIQLLYYDAL